MEVHNATNDEVEPLKDDIGDAETRFVRKIYNFYQNHDTPYSLDVAFNHNITRIIASRLLVQGELCALQRF